LTAQGNAAARGGDYAAALVLYEAAQEAGEEATLLAFNRGVAEYRLNRLDAAETSFLAASESSALRARASYNLGLVARARNERREAAAWFRQAAAAPTASPALRLLAERAARAMEPRTVSRTKRPSPLFTPNPERSLDFFDLGATTQIAMDSNVYGAPSGDYVDLAQPGAPTVSPDVQSAMYVPVEVFARAEWGRWDHSRFHAGYVFEGDFYTDSEYSNANRQSHVFSIDNVFDRETSMGRIYLSSRFLAAHWDREAFDRDDGSDQIVDGQDVSDRLRYTQVGPRVRFAHDIGRFRWGATVSGYVNAHDESVAALDYSNAQASGGLDFSYEVFDRTRVIVDGAYGVRVYETYPARESDGTRFTLNPNLEYTYLGGGVSVRHQLARSLWLEAGYEITDRSDDYEGYDDYRRDAFHVDAHLRWGRVSGSVSWVYRDYEFPGAFAFDTPAGGEKTLTTQFAALETRVWLWRDLYLTANGTFELWDSSDARYELDRTRAAIGIQWRI
jgi:hypothetical protein